MRVALIVPSLEAGGAERVLALLAPALAARGHEVSLVTLADADTDFYDVAAPVRRVGLGVLEPGRRPPLLRGPSRLRRWLRREQPDVAVSFILKMNLVTLLAVAGLGVPVIVSERVDRLYPTAAPLRMLRRTLYPRAATLVVQTDAAARSFAGLAARLRTIPNPVPVAPDAPGAAGPDDPPLLLGVGRLHEQKGFDLLLRAFASLPPELAPWRLELHGEGPRRAELTALAGELGVADRVALPGRTTEIDDVYRRASLFVLSSRWEGFPNVLVEAMARGLPCVSFACPSGPDEIIRDGEDGILVPDGAVEALAGALARAMTSPELRAHLAAAAPAVAERFSVEAVTDRWEAALAEAAT